MGIVERVKISAAEKGLTLAKIERTLGFGNSTIRKWDQNSPSLDKVIATANLLNKSLSWLATGNYENASGDSEFICLYEKLSELEKEKADAIYACGPVPMLKSVSEIADKFGIYCEVSLEERMGCGIGACLVCACKVKKDGEEHFAHVCKNGPVFNSKEVIW